MYRLPSQLTPVVTVLLNLGVEVARTSSDGIFRDLSKGSSSRIDSSIFDDSKMEVEDILVVFVLLSVLVVVVVVVVNVGVFVVLVAVAGRGDGNVVFVLTVVVQD